MIIIWPSDGQIIVAHYQSGCRVHWLTLKIILILRFNVEYFAVVFTDSQFLLWNLCINQYMSCRKELCYSSFMFLTTSNQVWETYVIFLFVTLQLNPVTCLQRVFSHCLYVSVNNRSRFDQKSERVRNLCIVIFPWDSNSGCYTESCRVKINRSDWFCGIAGLNLPSLMSTVLSAVNAQPDGVMISAHDFI